MSEVIIDKDKTIKDLIYANSLLQKEVETLSRKPKKILLVEDGSVDTDQLEELGIEYIIYRQGSKPPYFIEIEE